MLLIMPAPAGPALAADREVTGTVTGTVFRDIDHDGARGAGDPGVPGVAVRASDTQGATVGTATTDATGRYRVTVADRPDGWLRLEFGPPPPGLFPAPVGRDNAGTVQFVSLRRGGDSATADHALADPAEFCEADPRIVTACFVAGGSANRRLLHAVPWHGNGRGQAFGSAAQLGSVWGLAWQRERRRLFAAAFVRHAVGLGPGGPGAIYMVTPPATGRARVSTFATLPAGPAGGEVGTVGLGALDLDAAGTELYVLNLHDRRLYVLPVAGTRHRPPTDAAFRVPDPGCAQGTARPLAVRYHRAKVYVGVTCDGRELSGLVYAFDAASRRFDPTPLLTVPFDRATWRPWRPDAGDPTDHQPWLSDIDFLDNGDMVLSVMDRVDHQASGGRPAGEVLRARLHPDGSYTPAARVGRPSDAGLGGAVHKAGTRLTALTAAAPTGGYAWLRDGRPDGARIRRAGLPRGVTAVSEPELLCRRAPLELGNRVWLDADGDGIQDAGEPGIGGVRVALRSASGQTVARRRTAPDGTYVFRDADVRGGLTRQGRYSLALDDPADHRPGGPLAGTRPATPDIGDDTLDSDAAPTDPLGVPVTLGGSGQNNHSYDIGVVPPGVRPVPGSGVSGLRPGDEAGQAQVPTRTGVLANLAGLIRGPGAPVWLGGLAVLIAAVVGVGSVLLARRRRE